jgi:hypothetical protein
MLTSELSCAKTLNYWLARPGSASSFPLTPRTVPFITAIDSDLLVRGGGQTINIIPQGLGLHKSRWDGPMGTVPERQVSLL